MLSNQWLEAAEHLAGHPKGIRCENPASRQQFHNVAGRVLEHTPSPGPTDVEWARNITQRSALEFLETLAGAHTDRGQWTTERVNALVDSIRQMRAQRAHSTPHRPDRLHGPC